MSTKYFKTFQSFAITLGLSFSNTFIISQAYAATTGNLLQNGDAETQRCTNDWTAQTSVPGWHVLRGAVSVLCYSAFKIPNETPFHPANGKPGKALFGAPGIDTAMEQTIDVSAAAKDIDRGKVAYTLSAWLGGWRNRPESATVTAIFLDVNGNAISKPVMLANVDASTRNNLTGLVARQAKDIVPARTRQIVITVNFLSGMTSFHNAYADNLSLVLNGHVNSLNGLIAASVTEDPENVGIPHLDHLYIVMMENTNYADVFHMNGNSVTVDSRMPFLGSLVGKGVMLTNMWGTYHPSDQNYVAMIAGDTYKYGQAYFPYNLTVSHIGNLMDDAGLTWVSYVQNMGTPCDLQTYPNGSWYSPDDEPFSQFSNVISKLSYCTQKLRDLTEFETDIANNTLPTFAWIAPDGYSDGEGAWGNNYKVADSISTQDAFLQSTFKPLLNSTSWNNSRSLLIITWDESQAWGWPDNHIPTVLVGSPGLLNAGTTIDQNYNGYSLLRTIEKVFNLKDLDRFDTYAKPITQAFKGVSITQSKDLRPDISLTTRGSIKDTFGTAATPAAVFQGQPILLYGPNNLYRDSVVSLVPFGQIPTESTPQYNFNSKSLVSIPSTGLAPGLYAAWLERSSGSTYRAPVPVAVLPAPKISMSNLGVEIVGLPVNASHVGVLCIREGSNFIVHYCRPTSSTVANTWIGIFPVGTPAGQMTQSNEDTNLDSYWIRTPGDANGQTCGEAEVFSSELTPGEYQVLLFMNNSKGVATPVGSTSTFKVFQALP